MQKTKVAVFATISLVAFGLSSQAAADQLGSGWYLGADLGHVELQLEDPGNISNKNLSDSVFAIHGGYRFSRYFAIESTYADIGDYSYQANCPVVCGSEYPADISISGKRLDLTLVGSIPLGERFEVYAKTGLARTENEYKSRSLNQNFRLTDSSSDAIYGVGLRMHFNTPWSLRLQWDRTQLGRGLPDVDAWWLGAEYRFGSR